MMSNQAKKEFIIQNKDEILKLSNKGFSAKYIILRLELPIHKNILNKYLHEWTGKKRTNGRPPSILK
jgi:hypothetical protein